MYKHHFAILFPAITSLVLSGCLGGGLNNAGYPGNYPSPNTGYPNAGYPNVGYPNTGYPNVGYPNAGTQGGAYGAIQNAVIAAIIQGMAGSVLNGQIGSQLAPVDQNFRLQQLGGMLQSGATNQAQQWLNPKTGSRVSINPLGQLSLNPQTQQQCRELQETITLTNGQILNEKRKACLDSRTGKWNLIQ